MSKTVKHLLLEAANQLALSDSARLDAQLLLAHVLDKDRTWLFTWDDKEVSEDQCKEFNQLVLRRIKGEPIAYILGKREFWGLELECDTSTLIPRPETELIVEQALQLTLPQKARVLDLGTGTGAIALALATEKPDWKIMAFDVSVDAVALAESNRLKHQLANVQILQSNWFEALEKEKKEKGSEPFFTEKAKGNNLEDEKRALTPFLTPFLFDLIVSNPPYIDPNSHYLKEGDVRFEPTTALTAEHSGMADIEKITSQAGDYLQSNGWLMLEHGFDQQQLTQACFKQAGFEEVQTLQDLAGLPRVTLGCKPGARD